MRILVVGPVVAGLLGLTASCAPPPPEAAALPPPPSMAVAEPAALTAPSPPPPVVAVAPPAPPREVEYVPVPLLWWRMMAQPLPAGRLMLNNFSFEPTHIQAALTAEPVCAIADPSASAEFVLPSNGTRVIPAPPGFDVCWRRELVVGETADTPTAGPWTAWSRAYTGPGRFLDATVVIPPRPPAISAVENAPAPPPPSPEPSS